MGMAITEMLTPFLTLCVYLCLCTVFHHTGVKLDILKSVGMAITEMPADFTPHRQIKKVYETRRQMIETGGTRRQGVRG